MEGFGGFDWRIQSFLREQMKKHFYSTGCVRKVMAAFAVILSLPIRRLLPKKAPAVASLPKLRRAPGQGARKKTVLADAKKRLKPC